MSPAIFIITYRVTGLGIRDRRAILNTDINPPTRTIYLRSSRFIEINWISSSRWAIYIGRRELF